MCPTPAKLGEPWLQSAAAAPVSGCSPRGTCCGKMSEGEFAFTHALAQDYLRHVLQVQPAGLGASKAARVLRDVAFSIQEEVEKSLQPYLDKCDVASVDTARTIFNQVMEKEFEDGVINWGRIVTIFAFGGVLIKKLLRERIAPDVDTYMEISYFVAEFIVNNTGEWIKQNGGWVCVTENAFTVLYCEIRIASFLANYNKAPH
jgi:hematopoietic BCL2-related protein A1